MILRRAAVDRSGGFNEQFTGADASSEDLVFFAKVMLREEAGQGRKLYADSTDAGQAFKLIDFYPNIQGGRVRLELPQAPAAVSGYRPS